MGRCFSDESFSVGMFSDVMISDRTFCEGTFSDWNV